MRHALLRGAAAAVLLAGGSAHATYSIVATDSSTGRVGGATTSCVGALSVSIVYGSAPGHGAVHAQAQFNTNGRDVAAMRLGMDVAPADIIAEITDPAFDGNAARRQYGIADLMGRAAGWTGAQCQPYAEDRQGQAGPYTYSAQGNILTSAAVLDQTEDAFVAGGCDLADSLMLALEAGAENGEGDSRCTPVGIPSDSAFLTVEEADGTVVVALDVTQTYPASAVAELRVMYDAWRATHPCPIILPDAGPPDAQPAADGGLGDGDGDGCSCRASGRSSPASGSGLALTLLAALALLGLPLRPDVLAKLGRLIRRRPHD
jgi:uncharacterized Ntn-hydrolase superfamily protein